MFLSNAYIQLVFADDTDTYYCDDLLQFDLNRYLWRFLHENGCRTVYYINEEKNGKPTVWNYGERGAADYTGQRWLQSCIGNTSEDEHFLKWIQDRLQEKEKNAVVCPLEVFCRLTGRVKNIGKVLDSQERSGSIILVAPPDAERTGKLLLTENPVFDVLGIQYILTARGAETADYYNYLKHRSDGACVFLNSYTAERLTVLLKHVVFRHFERCPAEGDLQLMGEYLFFYLNNRFLQLEEPVFETGFDLRAPTYSALYNQLIREKVWTGLVSRSAAVRPYGSVLKYLKNTYPELTTDLSERQAREDVWAAWDPNSPEGRCMHIRPRDDGSAADSFIDKTRHRKHLNDLWRHLRRYGGKNQMNADIREAMLDFLGQLDGIIGSQTGDYRTYRRLVYGLSLFAEYRYRRDPETVGQMIAYLKGYIACSARLFELDRKYRRLAGTVPAVASNNVTMAGTLAYKTYLEWEQCLANLQSAENGLPCLILQLSGSTVTDEQEEQLKNAQEILEQMMGNVLAQQSAADGETEPDPAPVEVPAEEPEENSYQRKSMFRKPF